MQPIRRQYIVNMTGVNQVLVFFHDNMRFKTVPPGWSRFCFCNPKIHFCFFSKGLYTNETGLFIGLSEFPHHHVNFTHGEFTFRLVRNYMFIYRTSEHNAELEVRIHHMVNHRPTVQLIELDLFFLGNAEILKIPTCTKVCLSLTQSQETGQSEGQPTGQQAAQPAAQQAVQQPGQPPGQQPAL